MKRTMKAMVWEAVGRPLREIRVNLPQPGEGELLLRVEACAVCRTDLHIVDGELGRSKLPLILGHEIVGKVEELREDLKGYHVGQRVGVPWLGHTCGVCAACEQHRENLCERAQFTGYTRDGGFAEYVVADARYAFPLPSDGDAVRMAPLLCAGLIGHRSYCKAGEGQRLGLYGFGAAAHILTQIAVAQGRDVFAFTRPGDEQGQQFARRLGACWAGGSDESPPQLLDAAIIFAPVGALVPQALASVRSGGRVVCGGIHMSDIPQFPYSLLWGERSLCSVANLTRRDGVAFFSLVSELSLEIHTTPFALAQANEALSALRSGALQGAAVLLP